MSDSHLYGEDLVFADQLLERLYEFTKREHGHPEDAMVLECVDGRHRYIVHQAVQIFPTLASFSVGDGKHRRPVVCFAAKLATTTNSTNTNGDSRTRRKLYQPPTSRRGGGDASAPGEKRKTPDEKLQTQLISRMNLITRYYSSTSEDEVESIEELDRVPNLNPHAASFIPYSIQNTVHANEFVPQCNNYGYSTTDPYTQHLTQPIATALNPTVPDFTPRLQPPQLNQKSESGASMSAYINTYQEFVPASESHKMATTTTPTQSPPDSSKPEKDENSPKKKRDKKAAYVPPPLRNKKPLTEDEADRLKNQERKERVMVERQAHHEEKETPSPSRSGYAAFKKEKKKKPTQAPTPSPKQHVHPLAEASPRVESLRRDSGSATPDDDDYDHEYTVPLCWADDDPLDQTVIDDITKAVPGLKLKRSYDFALPNHMLEIYDFPKSVRTGDLLTAFQEQYSGFSVRWVDDTHAIAIFASATQANECESRGGCGSFRVRSLANSSDAARKKASLVAREQRFDVDLEPAERPKTSAVVARRLIAANVDGKIARQIRAAEEEEKLIKGERGEKTRRKSRSKSESKN